MEVARQILSKLIDGRLTMTTKMINGGRFYEITGTATYGRLFEGVLVNVVAPARHTQSDRHSPRAGAG